MNDAHMESLLQAWLNMEMCIRGNRVLHDMSFNEMTVCHILLQSRDAGQDMTATDLCDHMHLLKSQMNVVINALEERGYIRRVRSDADRRRIRIEMTAAGEREYHLEHDRILRIMQGIREEIGDEDTERLASLIRTATNVYQRNVLEEL